MLQPLSIPNQPWIDIAMNFISGHPNSKGYEVIWVIIDRNKLHISTSYHPQSDGSTERINQCLEQYVISMCSHSPKRWSSWLHMAEWWFNITFHTSLQTTPYKILYGHDSIHLSTPSKFSTNIAAVEDILAEK